jgi:methionine-S-sulfoxide reductase
VVRTRVGYAGGTSQNPTYRSIGDHAESIQVDFDPAVITYEQLLDVFWSSHDPFATSYSRQYAAILFFHDSFQHKTATEYAARLETEEGRRILTEVIPFKDFFVAEDYHQKYYLKGNRVIYDEFRAIYPEEDDLVGSTAAARVNGYLGGNGNRGQMEKDLPLLGLSHEAQNLMRRFLP